MMVRLNCVQIMICVQIMHSLIITHIWQPKVQQLQFNLFGLKRVRGEKVPATEAAVQNVCCGSWFKSQFTSS